MIRAAFVNATDGEDEPLSASGPVTAQERGARWGHQGGTIELIGPTEVIDAIERSLFVVGVVSQRIDASNEAFQHHPEWLGMLRSLQLETGLLGLVVTATDSDQLTVRVKDQEETHDAGNVLEAIAAVHRMLHSAEILYDTERAGL
jgi:hypothetical protein